MSVDTNAFDIDFCLELLLDHEHSYGYGTDLARFDYRRTHSNPTEQKDYHLRCLRNPHFVRNLTLGSPSSDESPVLSQLQ